MQKQESKIIDYFSVLKRYQRISNTYLFVSNRLDFVLDIAKLINCEKEDGFCGKCHFCLQTDSMTNPDLYVLKPQKSFITIDQIREVQKFLVLKNFACSKKIVIVDLAHKMGIDSANAFLKTLEEPPNNAVIILLSERVDLMLPTIISRCRKLYLAPTENRQKISPHLSLFFQAKEINIKKRDQLSEFLHDLIVFLRDYMVYYLYADINKLINKANYEIIGQLRLPYDDAREKLESVLDIYSAVDNINLNLASNLLKLKFQ